jgi:hypothetical protein
MTEPGDMRRARTPPGWLDLTASPLALRVDGSPLEVRFGLSIARSQAEKNRAMKT